MIEHREVADAGSVENVENVGYYASAYSGVVGLGAPRTYLLSTTFNF